MSARHRQIKALALEWNYFETLVRAQCQVGGRFWNIVHNLTVAGALHVSWFKPHSSSKLNVVGAEWLDWRPGCGHPMKVTP